MKRKHVRQWIEKRSGEIECAFISWSHLTSVALSHSTAGSVALENLFLFAISLKYTLFINSWCASSTAGSLGVAALYMHGNLYDHLLCDAITMAVFFPLLVATLTTR